MQIDLDPTPIAPSDRSALSGSDCVRGVVHYPNGEPPGILIYAKAAVTRRTPWNARAFALRDRRFPSHSTSNQFFDDTKFESYRSLGYATAERAVAMLRRARPRAATQ